MEPCAREMEQEGCSVWAKGVGEGGRWSESMWAICSLRRDPEAEPRPPQACGVVTAHSECRGFMGPRASITGGGANGPAMTRDQSHCPS